MRFSVVTLFPEMVSTVLSSGVVGSSFKSNINSLELVNPREFATDVHKSVDDKPYGGADGMVMSVEPLVQSMKKIQVGTKSERDPKTLVLAMSPQGKTLDLKMLREFKGKEHIVIVCGRYAGIDQRFLNQYVDHEVSIGDYVLSGGELAACVVIDSLSRQLSGVLGNSSSVHRDSFEEGLLESPLFTRPREALGQIVPEFLTSGNHEEIRAREEDLALLVTLQKRPDLLSSKHINQLEKALVFYQRLAKSERDVFGLRADLEIEFKLLKESFQ